MPGSFHKFSSWNPAGGRKILSNPIGAAVLFVSLLLGGSVIEAEPALQLRMPFMDAGPGTTTASDTSGGGINVTMGMFTDGTTPGDLHGASGTGITNFFTSRRALDQTTNTVLTQGNTQPGNNNSAGPLVALRNDSTLATLGNNGVLSNFVVTFWMKQNAIMTSSATPRLWILSPGSSAGDYGANANGMGMQFQATNQLWFAFGNTGNTFRLNPVFADNLPPQQWIFIAVTYDGTQFVMYYGTASQAATPVQTNSAANLSINLAASGGAASLAVGNKDVAGNFTRSFNGWFNDFRFYNHSSTNNALFVENIRGELALPPSTPPTVPVFTMQPSGAALLTGASTQLPASIAGAPPMAYQWQKGTNGIYSDLADIGAVSGSHTNTLALNSVALSDAADYRLLVTNSYGSATSQVATVSVFLSSSNAPVVLALNPSASAMVGNLTQIQVTFNKFVTGVDAEDLVVAGNAADSVSGSGSNYVFTFTQPSAGTILVYWDIDSGITDLSGNLFNTSSNWTYTVLDNIFPIIFSTAPAAGATVGSLTQAQVYFSKPVTGVNASAFLINGVPATGVNGGGLGPYVFNFTQPAPGTVQFSWSPGQNIRDSASNLFGGAGWTATLNPAATAAALTNIVINEFLAANTAANGLLDEDGLLDSWIEIYNRGAATVNLAGWSLTDDAGTPAMWTFPATNIAAGRYMMVFASGDDRRVSGANLHVNFKLGTTPSYLGLYNADFTPQAAYQYAPTYPEQRNNISYGLDNTNSLHYFAVPTPGGPNGFSTITGVVAQLNVSAGSGFFIQPTNVVLTTATPGATILYTTNGSVPSISGSVTNGTVYNGPANIARTTPFRAAAFAPNLLPALTVSRTWLFTEDIIRQPNNPPGYPTGNVWTPTPGTVESASRAYYQMAPAVVDDPQYTNAVRAGLVSIPTMSLMLPIPSLFDPNTGIYTHPLTHDDGAGDWERACSMELIFPDGSADTQIDCGVQIQGGSSRSPSKDPKHSFRLAFKSIYGAGKFKFPLFADSPVNSFNTLVIDGGNNYWWQYFGTSNPADQRNRAQCLRDQFTSDLMLAMGNPSFHGQFYNLYLNGLYWGIHYVHERPDDDFAASYFGGENTDYDVIRNTTSGTQIVAGDLTAWNTVLALANSGLANNAQYEQLQQYVDVDNLIDYMIVNHWADNTDWPQHNWYVIRQRAPGAGFKFVIWDAEITLLNAGENVVSANASGSPAQIYNALRNNAEFQLRFADHLQKHFSAGGALYTDPAHPIPDPAHPERNVPAALYLKRINEINTAVVDESARWGGYLLTTNYTRNEHWLREANNLLGYTNTPGNTANYFPTRSATLLSQYQAISLFPNVGAPAFNQLGGNVPAGFALVMVNPNAGGTIYYTANGTDPRVYGSGAVASGARIYTNGIPFILNQSVIVNARVLNGGNWSALSAGNFTVGSLGVPLRITELMYNPIGGSDYEFLEVQNIGATPLDVGGFSFSAGVMFLIPPNTVIPPGALLLLANGNSPAHFAQRYPGVTVSGYFSGNLNNGGELVAIVDASGQLVTEVTYNNKAGWPTAADGGGYSLELIDPYGDLNSPANWRASSVANGTPGFAPVTPPLGSVVLNEIAADNQTSVQNGGSFPDWLELYNGGANSTNLDNWSLSDSSNARSFVFPVGTIMAAGGYLVVWCDTNTAAPGLHTGFALSKSGENVFLYDANTNRMDAVSFGLQIGDLSLGRVNGLWQLTLPTTNAPNRAATLAAAANVSINEWLTRPAPGGAAGIELFNRSSNSPVALKGFYLATSNSLFRIGALSFLPPRGFIQLFATNTPDPVSVDLTMLANAGAIILSDATGNQLEKIIYGAQTAGVSEGRFPDGTTNRYFMPITTPGAANVIPNNAPSLNVITNRFVHLGQTLQLTVIATDADSWYQTLAFSLTNSPAGAAINAASGTFTWTVTKVPAPGTNSITVRVTDNGTSPLSDTKTFLVIVQPPLQFSSVTPDGNGNLNFNFNSLVGQSYQLEYKNNLNDPQWTPLDSSVPGTGGPLTLSDAMTAQPQRFYHLIVTSP
jgi:Lamin Tail Domain/CotH kinase protein/Chitobiase/beta-hexosaminidase C-terminal domain/Concanavalin A-like lectin/glucanases superfamily/Immunoglobulin I-set domain